MLGAPRIKHIDEVYEQEVVRIEFADGRTASIYERFLESMPRYFAFYNRWEPGMISLTHGHQGDHTVFVLEGEVTVGDRLCPKGTHIFLMHGDRFGPWVAGPDGCELLGVIAGSGEAFWSEQDMADYLALLEKNGAKQGIVPALKNREPWKAKGNPLPGPVS
ncbi:hypothetical protein CA223_22045 [Sphingomonas koreensis]|jgi:hypothetical protein|uniref:Cupin domain-containing protein n=1 Tax=Sphingomonas koreensis TaxID=93064 RepID=A0A1L6J576_9SPHN|nr:hypothetical protein [Sphingomonas koreensis]APR51069.1 hypothetical protein BRX40_00245 [Sphingomonas koreensis]MDC7810647.1 hypothetical protein [Sphingomonas koreensis]PJI89555.1 hypothetical protein BDW16_2870 [Sphingomonas koreensis]RSU17178.1 hypothetical protein CA224_22470 [Sphingomonas koreensis]RSU19513.1 hypothetical protein CA222_22515 [Sphingomonas koreensis]